MKIAIFAAIWCALSAFLHISTQEAKAQSFTAPFCVIDQLGNRNCFYYDMNTCRQQAAMMHGMCVINPNH